MKAVVDFKAAVILCLWAVLTCVLDYINESTC